MVVLSVNDSRSRRLAGVMESVIPPAETGRESLQIHPFPSSIVQSENNGLRARERR